MTDRQLAASVRFGRLVTLLCPDLTVDEERLTGYVCGFDRDNIRLAVVVPTGSGQAYLRNVLRSRAYVAGIEISDISTRSSEVLAAELEQIVKRFRDRVLEEYYPDRVGR